VLEIRTGSSYRWAFESLLHSVGILLPNYVFTPHVWHRKVDYNFVSPAVPALSEWGLIAMASILGLLGFMVIRKRKITA